MKNKLFRDLLNEYISQEKSKDSERLYIAFDNNNNSSGDCCQCWSDVCGSGNVASDCCFDALCCGCGC